jgi:hypothetical protein
VWSGLTNGETAGRLSSSERLHGYPAPPALRDYTRIQRERLSSFEGPPLRECGLKATSEEKSTRNVPSTENGVNDTNRAV